MARGGVATVGNFSGESCHGTAKYNKYFKNWSQNTSKLNIKYVNM